MNVVRLWDNNGRLGISVYTLTQVGVSHVWADTLNDSANSLKVLVVDRNGDGKSELLQMWDNGQVQTGMALYSPVGDGLQRVWSTSNAGSPPAAVAVLPVDIEGNHKTDLLQIATVAGKTAMYAYTPDPTSMEYAITWQRTNMGDARTSVAWLGCHPAGGKKSHVLQLWNNNSKLAMTQYSPASGGYSSVWSNPDMGAGPGAIRYLVVDTDGDGKSDIIQLWANGTALGMVHYRPQAGGKGYAKVWQQNNMSTGHDAIEYFAVDMNGDKKTEIIQLYKSGEQLGLVVYTPLSPGYGYGIAFQSGNMGQGYRGVGWLAADFTGDRKADILQMWNNNGRLAMCLYSAENEDKGYNTLWVKENVGPYEGAIGWLVAD